jgi:hypothetical protein
MWVIGGDDSDKLSVMDDAWSSSNGLDWLRAGRIEAFVPPLASTSEVARRNFAAAAYTFNGQEYIFIAGGNNTYGGSANYLNDTWFSADGAHWTKTASLGATTAFTSREGIGCAVFQDKIWLVGGWSAASNYYNDVWYLPRP